MVINQVILAIYRPLFVVDGRIEPSAGFAIRKCNFVVAVGYIFLLQFYHFSYIRYDLTDQLSGQNLQKNKQNISDQSKGIDLF